MTTEPLPTKCQEYTWKGKPCANRARFVINRSGIGVCLRHLNAFPPGVEYTPLDTTDKKG